MDEAWVSRHGGDRLVNKTTPCSIIRRSETGPPATKPSGNKASPAHEQTEHGPSEDGPLNTSPLTDDLSADLACLHAMVAARKLDELEARYVSNGEAFFHVSGAGHEASAMLAGVLKPSDWLHLHYRDKALMLARGLEPEQFFHSLFCNAESHSAGRQMSAHMSDPSLNVLSLVGPVGNNALQAVGVAAEVKEQAERPIVVCSNGDGTSQQGEVLEAIAEAVRESLPVVFLIHDNALAISTHTTGNTWYSLPADAGGEADSFYGIKIHRIDGRQPHSCQGVFESVTQQMREDRKPAIIVMSVERLANHTNADDESIYRGEDERQQARESGDPIENYRKHLRGLGCEDNQLLASAVDAEAKIKVAAERGCEGTIPATADLRSTNQAPDAFADESLGTGEPELTMIAAINKLFDHHLKHNDKVSLFGQDIEDPKGDVFGITRGLSTAYPKRVTNAPLTESTIVGKSVGRAIAGGKPVAMLQFADFVPLAFNQIISELGSIAWRTDGAWTCPAIVTAPCGGYRPGLGPFHAQTMESILSHVPGINVVMPSTATDAAGLLNAAFASDEPTVFLYPKVCLNDRDRKAPANVEEIFVPIGKAHHLQTGDDLTLVTYGGTTYQCDLAAKALADHGVGVDLIDLRSIKPWDKQAVIVSAKRTGRLIVVHEDNASCSVASEVVATVCEALPGAVQAERVTRPDVHVPCNFENQLDTLPSYQRVLETACKMLGLGIRWESNKATIAEGDLVVEAQGSSPADQAVIVSEWRVSVGDSVQAGDPIADLEADKAVFELTSPYEGVVKQFMAETGVEIRVGQPLLTLTSDTKARVKPLTREEAGTPHLSNRPAARSGQNFSQDSSKQTKLVTVGRPAVVHGGRAVNNAELIQTLTTDRAAEDIEQLTGIRSRWWVAEGEDALTLATQAAKAALKQHGLTIDDIDAIVLSTTTPIAATPSMACMLLGELSGDKPRQIPAHDLSAACSGYLYALTGGHDHIAAHPGSRVLVVTTEVLSPLLDPNDFDTAIIFGDAATATILGDAAGPQTIGNLHRPVLSAKADEKGALTVGFGEKCGVFMDGKAVFGQAVRAMKSALEDACAAAGIELDQLTTVVPHQANHRILSAVADRLPNGDQTVVDAIAETGNTSSSSIPLALAELPTSTSPTGLCAFGGGFTFGAAVLEAPSA